MKSKITSYANKETPRTIKITRHTNSISKTTIKHVSKRLYIYFKTKDEFISSLTKKLQELNLQNKHVHVIKQNEGYNEFDLQEIKDRFTANLEIKKLRTQSSQIPQEILFFFHLK